MSNDKITEQRDIIQRLNGDILKLASTLKESERTIASMKRQELEYLRDIDRLNDKVAALETSRNDSNVVAKYSNSVEPDLKARLEMLERSSNERSVLVQRLSKIISSLPLDGSLHLGEVEPLLSQVKQFFGYDKQHVRIPLPFSSSVECQAPRNATCFGAKEHPVS